MRLTARIILVFILTIFLGYFTSLKVLAQSTQSGTVNPYTQPNTEANVPKDLSTLTQSVVIDLLGSTGCLLGGIDATDPKKPCLGVNLKDGKIGYVESSGGAVGVMGGMVASLYTPQTSTTDYFRYMSGNFGGAKAYAQVDCTKLNSPPQCSYGFSNLRPYLNIWMVFRDIAYLVFILVFVIIGFAIMLRIQIDARTVMTIQNQIPKIIVGIVLVTFSYAIAAFLIDMMWVSTYVVINVFHSADSRINSSIADSDIQNPPIAFVNDMITGDFGGIFSLASTGGSDAKSVVLNIFTPSNINTVSLKKQSGCGNDTFSFVCNGWTAVTNFGSLVMSGVSSLLEGLLAWIADALILIVFLGAILFALFRLWFTLIKAWVFILIDVALGPIWILLGALPGRNGFSLWLRDLGANLIAFPTAIAMLLMGQLFMYASFDGNPFVPPIIGNPAGHAFAAIIGIGFIISTPQVVDLARQALKAPQVDLKAFGTSLGYGMMIPGRAAGALKTSLTTKIGPNGLVVQRTGGVRGAIA